MKHPIIVPAVSIALLAGGMAAQPVMAADSVANGSEAMGELSNAAALLGESGLQTAAAASVIPASVVAVGAISVVLPVLAVGAIASEAAEDSVQAAELAPAPRLVVSRQIIVAQPAPRVPAQVQKEAR